jgi:hypothetical protein
MFLFYTNSISSCGTRRYNCSTKEELRLLRHMELKNLLYSHSQNAMEHAARGSDNHINVWCEYFTALLIHICLLGHDAVLICYRRFGERYFLHFQDSKIIIIIIIIITICSILAATYFSSTTLQTKVQSSYKTSVTKYQPTRCHIPKVCSLQTHDTNSLNQWLFTV